MTTPEEMALAMQGSTGTELDISTNDGFAGMLSLYKEEAAVSAPEELADVDIGKLFPIIKLGRESSTLSVQIGEEPIPRLHGSKSIVVVLVAVIAQRTLWPPDRVKDFGRPICSTGWISPLTLKRNEARGEFVVNEFVDYPYPLHDESGEPVTPELEEQIFFDCASCPYNKFGSMASYEEQRPDSRAKACSEGRTYLAIPLEKVGTLPVDDEELYAYKLSERHRTSYNPYGVMLVQLSFGTNSKAIERFGLSAAVREVPLGALAFRIKNDLDTSGQYNIPKLDHNMTGLLVPSNFFQVRDKIREWCQDFIAQHKMAKGTEAVSDTGTEAF